MKETHWQGPSEPAAFREQPACWGLRWTTHYFRLSASVSKYRWINRA